MTITVDRRQPTTVDHQQAWARMLGAPPRPGDPERPAQPTTLGLSRIVKAHIRLSVRPPRAHGVHPSEIPYLCPVLFFYIEQARDDLSSEDPAKVSAAFKFLSGAARAKDKQFSPDLQQEFRVGSSIHTEVQYRLGVLGTLWGKWRCGRCHAYSREGWMPRVWVRDINGDRIAAPAPCKRCSSGNLRRDVPWEYLEPRVESEEWGVVGHTDGDLRILKDGWWYRYVLEIKSINRRGFEGKRGPLPEPAHITQASIYGWLMGASHIQFVYVCKDQVSRWKEFIVPVDPVAVAEAQNKIKAVRQAQQDGQAPTHARLCPNVQDERARHCPAVERCFGCRPVASFWDG